MLCINLTVIWLGNVLVVAFNIMFWLTQDPFLCLLGWLAKIETTSDQEQDEFMTQEQYDEYLKESS